MPSLPPPVWAELFYSGVWNTITDDVRVTTSAITTTRGLSAESSSDAEPTTTECALDNRDHAYSPRNTNSPLRGKIGRNTPFRWGYTVGSVWAEMPGINGNEITTPTNAAYNVTDLDVRIELSLEDWTLQQGLAARYNASGNNRSWGIYLAGTGQVALVWSPTGTATTITEFSTVPIAAHNGQRLALRVTLDVDNGAGGYEVRFYTGRTVDDDEWNLLGAPVTGAATTAVFAASSGIEIGDFLGLVLAGMTGKVFALKLLSGILGAAVLTMSTSTGTAGASSFTSNGVVWTMAGGATLTNKHVRMAGEVPAWPPTRDLSGNDTYTQITPTGITRRMDAGNKPVDSSLLRYLKSRDPIECWPLTDGVQTGVSGVSLTGGKPMAYRPTLGSDLPDWQGGSLAKWIEPTILFKAETTGGIRGQVPASVSAASAWSVDLFLSGGGQGAAGTFEINDRGAATDADNRIRIQLAFDAVANEITVFRASLGETSSSSALLTTISTAGIFNDAQPHHVRVALDPGATDTGWEIFTDGVSRATGTIAGIVVKAVNDVTFNWSLISGGGITTADQTIGYVTYWDATGPTAAQIYDAYTGFQGERAGTRIERLATESGYTATTAGELAYQQRMGVQDRKKLLELLNEASLTNFGYLLDRRDALEVIHRSHSTLWNQPPALTLDFSAGLISAPFKPDDGDKLTENDVSISRAGGAVPARAVLESGELSVQDFPSGVGRYDNAYTYSLYTDDQAANVASMRLSLGTYNGVRYTRITLDLANTRVFQLIDAILRLDVGDKLRLTELPEDYGPDDVDVLINGYTEEAGPDSWKITFNCVPADPWTAFVAGSDRYSRADTAGSTLNSPATSGAATMSVATAAGGTVWVDSTGYAAEFPFDVRVGGAGGEVVRVTAASGTTSPQTFTVTRAINGVQIAHTAGEDVRLAYPVYFPL
ncbi:hypothetical protein PV735_31565 [Streptomyces turgidiscabies]|uniref:hypothetical protein n=1 Tax=Streptomyces turgidiscabies TaxID=85558 RepID=UPI0029A16E38|nr:hypothetical protein [Streptomyces turgidiscabies]MDX3497190.1 hypothetical protein [Streptomyces turgidiscabies]